MPVQNFEIELEPETEDEDIHLKKLADFLSESDVRSYLSEDTIQTIRTPEPKKLIILLESIESWAIASVVYALISWQDLTNVNLIIHSGEQTFYLKNEKSVRNLLDFVGREIEELGSTKGSVITGPHGSGGSWDE